MFSETPIKYSKGTTRVINPSETIAQVEDKLKIAGISRITEITHLDRIGIPVFSAIRPLAAEGAVSIYAGKGATVNQAKASAIMEAFERYSAEKQESDEDKLFVGTMNSLEGDVVNPISLIIPNRLQSNPIVTRLEWMEAINMKTGDNVWVPANAVFHPYITRSASQIFKANTNGLASGNVLEEAILQALCEVIERDSWSIFEAFKNKVNLDLSTCEDSIIIDFLTKFEDAGIEISLLDLTSDVGVCTIAAVADDVKLKDPALLTMGIGTHLNPNIAIIRALSEVAQSRATQIHGTREDTVRADFMRKAGYERMKRINKHWFDDSGENRRFDELKDLSSNDISKDIKTILKLLDAVGCNDAYFVDLTREEIGIPVVRVIIPGMEVYAIDSERVGSRISKQL